MGLIDLAERMKRKKKSVSGVSFVNLIDKFLYQEQIDCLNGKKSGKDIETDCARAHYRLVKRFYRDAKSREEGYRRKYLHPSAIGGCARRTYYKHFGAPENKFVGSVADVASLQRIFSNGSYFHVRMQVLFLRMGLCKLEDIEVGFTIGDTQGTCDAIATVDGMKYIVDFKSSNDYIFKTLGNGNKSDYLKGYDNQMYMYMDAFKVKSGLFLYENKNNQRLHEVFLEFDEDAQNSNSERLAYLRKHLASGKPPQREGDGLKNWPCNRCDYTGICYNREEELSWLKSLKRKAKLSPKE